MICWRENVGRSQDEAGGDGLCGILHRAHPLTIAIDAGVAWLPLQRTSLPNFPEERRSLDGRFERVKLADSELVMCDVVGQHLLKPIWPDMTFGHWTVGSLTEHAFAVRS